ncbi:hypothetical protein GCM10027159_07040 [Lysobacter terrae]
MDTLVRTRFFLLAILPLAASCSIGVSKAPDQMCTELTRFAQSVQAGASHSVVLRGGWGGDRPNTLMTHDCRFFGYAPGEQFCAFLVPNTSWEFGHYNARRVASCLDSTGRQDFIRQLDKSEGTAEMSSTLPISGDKGVELTVRFEARDISVLTLSVVRHGD